MIDLLFNRDMTLYERRQKNLQKLIDQIAGGRRPEFCKIAGMDESRLGQLLSKTFREGKAFGERAARNLEQKLGLKSLYFDTDNDGTADRNLEVREPSPSYTSSTVSLIHVTAKELAILTAYNSATDMGKDLIETAAETAPKDLTKLKLVNSA